MEKEQWKWIPGYEGLYQISNFGNVLSFHNNENGKLRKLKTNVTGYITFQARKNGEYKSLRINKLVCESFNENQPSDKHQANHKDGNKSNNCADNLEWNTAKENVRHAFKTGLRNMKNGSKKRAVIQRTLNGDIIETYISTKAAANAMNGNTNGICLACTKKLHTYKGYIWDYHESVND